VALAGHPYCYPPDRSSTVKVTGLDLSLTGSGVATVETVSLPGYPVPTVPRDTTRTSLAEYGSKATTPDLSARGERLRGLATKICYAMEGSDLLLVEDLYMGSGTGGQLDRAGLWWLVVATATAWGIPVVAVTNNHLKMYALGRGAGKGTDKDYVLAAVVRRYPGAPVQSNNTADALVLAAMGARHLGFPLETDLPETHLRAMRAVQWPATQPTGARTHG
jgi:crossover junction endodeoxyribonuclease RuvC